MFAKNLFLTIAVLFFPFILLGSALTIEGYTRDTEGKAVPFAFIKISSTDGAHTTLNRNTSSDVSGYFSLAGLAGTQIKIEVRSMGYRSYSQMLEVGDQKHIDLVVVLEPSVRFLDEVGITSASLRTESLVASRSVGKLSRQDLDRYHGGTFVNQLEKLPGISSISTGVGIAKPVIRGMAFNRVMVNDHGIKQEGQQWGADHGLELDQFDVSAVEVVKGPASLIYGPDALGGAINILPASLPEAGRTRVEAQSLYKSNNNLRAFSVGAETNQKGIIFKGRYSQQDFDNYRVPASEFVYASFVLPIFENTLRNTAGLERNFSFTTGVKEHWGQSTLKVSRYHQEVGLFPGAVAIPTAFQQQRFPAKRSIDLPRQQNTHWKVLWNTSVFVGDNLLEADMGLQHNKRREMSLPDLHNVGPNPYGNLALALDLFTYTANLKYKLHHNAYWMSVFGWQSQLMENRYGGFEFLLPAYRSFQSGLFAFTEYRPSAKLRLNAGIRGDYGQHDIQEHLQPLYNSGTLAPTGEFSQRNEDIFRRFGNLSGSFGLAWQPLEAFSTKLNVGSSFRMPTAMELSSNGIHHGTFRHELGNKDLLPERGFQIDLELGFKHKRFKVVASPFASIYDRYIYLTPTPFFSQLPSGSQITWEFRQADSFFWGGELLAELDFGRFFQLTLGAEYVSANNLVSTLPLPLTPPLSVNAELSKAFHFKSKFFRKTDVFVEVRSVSAQNRVDRNEPPTPGYFLAEIGIMNHLSIGENAFDLSFHVENLFDTPYMNHLSRYRRLNLPEQGRNFIISLKVPININR